MRSGAASGAVRRTVDHPQRAGRACPIAQRRSTDVPSPARRRAAEVPGSSAGRGIAGSAQHVRSTARGQPASTGGESTVTDSFSSNGNRPRRLRHRDRHRRGGGRRRADSSTILPRRCRRPPPPSRPATPRSPSSAARRTSTRSAPARRSRPRISASSPRKTSRASTPGPTARSSGSSSSASGGSPRAASSSRSGSKSTARSSAREVDAVEAAVAPTAPRSSGYFDRLGAQTDPVEIARQAGTRPAFPALEQIGPDGARRRGRRPSTRRRATSRRRR